MAKDKAKLIKMGQKRAQMRGAPDFRMKESDALQMKQTVQQLAVSNNKLVEVVGQIQETKVIDRALEAHLMMQVVLGILVEKGLVTTEELNTLAQKHQMEAAGLARKADEASAEPGDVMLIRFKLFDGEKLIDDQMSQTMAYDLGSKGLPCDAGMVGMKKGEGRVFEVVFGDGFRLKDYANKPVQMHVWCVGLQVRPKAVLPKA